jgi:hypothetical protein
MHAGIKNVVTAQDRAAIEALLTEFYWRLDHADAGSVAELFIERGTLVTPHGALAGREQIGRWFAGRTSGGLRVTRHSWSNLRLSGAGQGRVTLEAHVLTAAAPSSAQQPIEIMFGDTTDLVVKDALSGWMFESRRLDVALQGQMSPGSAGIRPGAGDVR